MSTRIFFFLATPLSMGLSGTLAPGPGIESVPPAVEAQSLDYWATREIPVYKHFMELN